MKMLGAVIFIVGLVAGTTQAQGPKEEIKEAGRDVKEAGKDTGRAAKHTGKAIKKGTKKAVHKGAVETEKAADKVKEKTK
jgi:hypothetical protein